MWVMGRGQPDAGPFMPEHVKAFYQDPLLRDTVTVNSNSYVVARFVANNPGLW